jgi:Fe-S cluster assembly protein SufD
MSDKMTEFTIPELAPALERGPLWLRDMRRSARDSFNKMPIPPRGLHLWRYTDPTRFLFDRDEITDTAFSEDYDAVQKLEMEHLNQGHIDALVCDLAGREIKIHGVDKLTSRGVIVSSLSEAVDKHRGLVEQYLYQIVNQQTGKFEAMNGALWNDGIFIYVPDNQTVIQPIHLLREAGLAHSSQFPRLLVVAGKNAELTIVDEYGGGAPNADNGISHSNGVVEIFGLQDSRVRFVSLQRHHSGMHSYMTHRARIEKGASMLTIAMVFGSILSKQNFGVIMNGEGAESNMYGLLFGTGKQQFDNHTLHHHVSNHSKSKIDFKTVLGGKSTSAYTGLIRIENQARFCEAYQENRNLLLNPGTRVESIPELEILNEEVICSHGATVGPIDPMEIFYLNSRGIPNDVAVRMVVSGFVATTLRHVPQDLTERITNIVAERLEDI